MSVFDSEKILPGVITEIISDYATGYDTSQFGTTDSVTIIGTAFDGPVGKPVEIYSPEHARYVFGQAFDSTTRKEATLVAEIQNAWDRGCRTIYAVRMSGKDMYKDFDLASNVDCKLRVSGIFPSNKNKDVFFEYNAVDTLTEEANGTEACINIYKPASRATIEEKMLGRVVKENSILVNSVKLRNGWNITESSRLADFVKLFNEYNYNNVIILSLVDSQGNDITNSELAQGLSFGELLPGVYFVGRDSNSEKISVVTKTEKTVVTEANAHLFANNSGTVVTRLKVNTDVTKPLPIFHNDVNELNELICKVQDITMSDLFDFFKIPGKVDLLWAKDKVDYEEVTMSDFEAYEKLGSGFANTAKIVETREGSNIFKVVEVTNENDENRIQGINDGIYSALENLTSDYRVLAGRYADSEIKGKLPKKKDFLISQPATGEVFEGKVKARAVIDKKDVSFNPSKYTFNLIALDEMDDLFDRDEVYAGVEAAGLVKYAVKVDSSDIEELALIGELDENVLVLTETNELHKIVDGKAVKIDKAVEDVVALKGCKVICEEELFEIKLQSQSLKAEKIEGIEGLGKYLFTEINGKVVVCEVVPDDSTIEKVVCVATLEEVLEEATSMFVAVHPSIEEGVVTNVVDIRVADLESTTLGEFVIMLNENDVLKELFTFEIHSELGEEKRYEVVMGEDAIFETVENGEVVASTTEAFVDRTKPAYDKSAYITFRTNDNFARQLAQHVVYTGLKTAPTHGVIGCSKMPSNSLKAVADRVDKLAELDLGLYAKKPNGNDILDKNNMPYPIGRAVSVTCFQNNVETGDNYTYVSTGAAAYAGMVSTLDIDQSSTAQTIDLDGVAYDLTNYQLGRLTKAGFVTVKNSYTKGYVVTDGITMAPVTSSFRRLSVSRIINGVDEAIRGAAEPFIGKQNSLANRNSLQTAIKSTLDKMTESLIEQYDFKVVSDRAAEQLGIIEIEYSIIPIYEIREVRNTITVKNSSN